MYTFQAVTGDMSETDDITGLLKEWRQGDSVAENQLFDLVVPDLRRLAHYLMQRERKGHTLQPTELVDQIYFRLVAAKNQDWQNRRHFFAIAARAMRRYLIDHARGRPDVGFVAINGMDNLLPAESPKADLAIAVDQLLNELAQTNREWCGTSLSWIPPSSLYCTQKSVSRISAAARNLRIAASPLVSEPLCSSGRASNREPPAVAPNATRILF